MPKARNRSLIRRILRFTFISTAVISFSILAFVSALVYVHSRDLPDINDVNAIANSQTSKIYSSDGALLANLFSENRTVVPLQAVSGSMIDATVAAEDERYFEHKGIDFIGIARAFKEDVKAGEVKQGGSTISQQYIKNAYFSNEKSIGRKIKEAVLAFNLERQSSKMEILEKYLNIIYFGHGAYGIETASETFFNKKAKDLTLAEAATLAGVIKNPTRYSPYLNRNNSVLRRNYVLRKMVELQKIEQKQYEEALKQPLIVQPVTRKHYKQADYFVEDVRRELFATYGENLLLRGGLKIETSLDSRLQRFAEEAAAKELNRPGDPSVAIVAIDVNTGAIKAMVGGRDFSKSQFNLGSQSKRQPGSAFKTFLLAAAITKGISPLQTYSSDSPFIVDVPGSPWKVSNYEGRGRGRITLKEAITYSVNTVFARLILDIRPVAVASLAKSLGIVNPVEPNLAISLGGLKTGVSPLEMASSYMSFANGGYLYDRYYVNKITDFKGNTLAFTRPVRRQVVDEKTAFMVTDSLKDVIKRGTGKAADFGANIAGKTGTTQNYADAWFVGYSSGLVVSVWMGYPDRKVPMKNLRGGPVTGGSFPARIWRDFMLKSTAIYPLKAFKSLPDGSFVKILTCSEPDMAAYMATEYCNSKKERVFVKGFEPVMDCPVHRPSGADAEIKVRQPRAPLIPAMPGLPGFTDPQDPKLKKRLNINPPAIPEAEAPPTSSVGTSSANQ